MGQCDPQRLQTEMGPGAADIAEIVPEVRQKLPDLAPPPYLDPEQARFRLFDSIAAFLKNAASDQPLLLSWTTCTGPTSLRSCCWSFWPGRWLRAGYW